MWKGPVLTYCFGKFSEKGTLDCVHLALSTGLIPDGWTLDSIADNELHFFKVRCRPFRYCTLLLKHVFIIGQLICNLKWSKRLPYCLELRICFQATQSLLKLICKILGEYGSCNQMVSARQILCLFISHVYWWTGDQPLQYVFSENKYFIYILAFPQRIQGWSKLSTVY